MTITEFLNARYDEEEAAAKAAGGAPWTDCVPGMVHVDPKARPAPCDTLRHMAAVYVGHPDYRQEWAL